MFGSDIVVRKSIFYDLVILRFSYLTVIQLYIYRVNIR